MSYKYVGLVFSGGGARGAYQIGVWKALREIGLDRNVRAIAGTSIGAINAALFLQGDIAVAEKAWLSISPAQILSLKLRVNVENIPPKFRTRVLNDVRKLAQIGIFSRDGLNELIDSYINLELVSNSPVASWATCKRMAGIFQPEDQERWAEPKVEYFPLNGKHPEQIRSYLLASSAIPGVFSPEEIDGIRYTDGGIGLPADLTPIKPVHDHGCDLIIVVHTERTQMAEVNNFPGSRVLEIVPQEHLDGLKGTFDFTPTGARRRMEQGYNDARRIIEPVVAMAKSQVNITNRLVQIRNTELAFAQRRAQLRRDRARMHDELNKLLGED